MDKVETRAIEIRIEADPERRGPGRLVGTLLTYGERSGDRAERFEAGALHWEAGGVVLREQHNRFAPIARFTPEVEGRTVKVSVVLPDTSRARDCATNIRAGVFRGLSVEFHAERERWDGELRIIERARLVGAGLVDEPSYKGSVVSMRARGEGRRRLWL